MTWSLKLNFCQYRLQECEVLYTVVMDSKIKMLTFIITGFIFAFCILNVAAVISKYITFL